MEHDDWSLMFVKWVISCLHGWWSVSKKRVLALLKEEAERARWEMSLALGHHAETIEMVWYRSVSNRNGSVV